MEIIKNNQSEFAVRFDRHPIDSFSELACVYNAIKSSVIRNVLNTKSKEQTSEIVDQMESSTETKLVASINKIFSDRSIEDSRFMEEDKEDFEKKKKYRADELKCATEGDILTIHECLKEYVGQIRYESLTSSEMGLGIEPFTRIREASVAARLIREIDNSDILEISTTEKPDSPLGFGP